MKKTIIYGIGILIILLALAGTGSAKSGYTGADCGFCHKSIVDSDYSLTTHGSNFRDVHKFDGLKVPSTGSSCLTCHPDMTSFLPLTSVGSSYSESHRYNATTLAAKMLTEPGCSNCHVNVVGNNFNLLTGTPTYLKSTTCQACHKAKYDKWSNTLHAVMLTPANKAQAMNLPTPAVGWAGISYVLVTKFELAYIDTAGYFLATNDAYETETQTFASTSHAGGAYGTCGKCHTTGWNASARDSSLPGFSGTLAEPGIACERCHGAAGNGHQVTINYSGDQCRECHTGGNHGTGWELGAHAPPAKENGSCMLCHSPFDLYKNPAVTTEDATNVGCGVCHNIHDMTDDKYAATFTGGTFDATAWSEVADSKLAFFNATASVIAGTDVFDNLTTSRLINPGSSSGLTGPIDLTGKPDSVVLCSKCHYNHGLAHMYNITFSHAGGNATCVDCHMEGANAKVGKGMMKNHDNKIDSGKSCGGVKCHGTSVTSDPLVAGGSLSMQKRFDEWGASMHNVKDTGFAGPFNTTTGIGKSKANNCNVCHDPINYDPSKKYVYTAVPMTNETFKGITCSICHPLHEMDLFFGPSGIFGKSTAIGLYEKVLVGTRYKGTYKFVASSTELCGSCHSNDHPRLKASGSYAEPGWPLDQANPNSPHGWPAAELFVGSWKQTGLLEFECTSCHFATLTSVDGVSLPQDQRVRGHSFAANATLLQLNPECSSCHVTGSKLGDVGTSIQNIKDAYNVTYNPANAKVTAVLANVKAYGGEKNESRNLIAQAYWKVRSANSDGSRGVHNPTMAKQWLDEAVVLADAASAALGNNTLASAVTPNNRNAQVGTPVTVFMSVINSGTATATGVRISQNTSLPATVSYQQWNSATGTLMGSADTPFDITAGSAVDFVLTITPTSEFSRSSMTFNVSGNRVAAVSSVVNTLMISASTTPSADVIMMSTSLNVSTAVSTSTAFALATTNVGGAAATGVSLVVSVPATVTGLAIQVNETNPDGSIKGPATGLTIGIGGQPTFAVFLNPTQAIAYDPTNNRITLELRGATGTVIGSQSVAVSTT